MPVKVGLTSKSFGSTTFSSLAMPLVLLALVAIGGCASQTEMIRLQGQVVELRKQLEYEKQRLKQATEKAGSSPDQKGGSHPREAGQ